MGKLTRKWQLVIVAINAVATTIVVAFIKEAGADVTAGFFAGVGTGAAIVFVALTNREIADARGRES